MFRGRATMRSVLLTLSLAYALSFALALTAHYTAQNPAQSQPATQPSTRPPENNDRTLRPLTPEELPPNLNFYAIDPLYRPGIALGWSDYIELKRSLIVACWPWPWRGEGLSRMAIAQGRSRTHRLQRVPVDRRRNTGQVKRRPCRQNHGFRRSQPSSRAENAWFVKEVINGREGTRSARVTLPANAPAQRTRQSS